MISPVWSAINMMSRNVLLSIIISVMLLVFTSCSSSGPDQDKIKELAISKFNPLPHGLKQPYEVHKFQILNKFTKEVKGQKVHFYEITFKIMDSRNGEVLTGTHTQTNDGVVHITLPVVKEGDFWRYL